MRSGCLAPAVLAGVGGSRRVGLFVGVVRPVGVGGVSGRRYVVIACMCLPLLVVVASGAAAIVVACAAVVLLIGVDVEDAPRRHGSILRPSVSCE